MAGRGEGVNAPKCRFCGERHWSVCHAVVVTGNAAWPTNMAPELTSRVTEKNENVTEKAVTVTEIQSVTKKRGRPAAGGASHAERQRAYRARLAK